MIRTLLVLVVACALATPAFAQQRTFGAQARLQIEKGWTRACYVHADVDGDGREDLAVGVYRDDDPTRRELRVHLQDARAFAFAQTPAYRLELPRDVVAFALADLADDAGREFALFSARSAIAWLPRRQDRERFARIGACDFLWQTAGDGRLMAIQEVVVDLDGDGLDDLLVPEPSGYRVFRARREDGLSTFEDVRLEVPVEPMRREALSGEGFLSRTGGRIRVNVPISGADRHRNALERRPPLVALEDAVPRPRVLDFDGDGRRDVVARGERTLWVWPQDGEGGFGAAPASAQPTPVVADRSRRVDISFGSHFADLDGDRKLDAVVIAGDQRAEEPRAQVMVFRQGRGGKEDPRDAGAPLFGRRGLPDQLLVLLGFAVAADLVDVDGDGLPDLSVAVLKTDDAGGFAGGGSVKVEQYVYRNVRGVLSSEPVLRHAVEVELADRSASRRLGFFADVTGDGVRELVARTEAGRVVVLMVKKVGDDAWRVFDRPLVELDAADADAHWGEDPRPWIVLSGKKEITVQRFP